MMSNVIMTGTKNGQTKEYDFHWTPGITDSVDFPYMISAVQFRKEDNPYDFERILEYKSARISDEFKKEQYKYITFQLEDDEESKLFTVLFDHDIFHSDFVDVIEELSFETGCDYEIISAGFCEPNGNFCFGISESLGKDSNPDIDNRQLTQITSAMATKQ